MGGTGAIRNQIWKYALALGLGVLFVAAGAAWFGAFTSHAAATTLGIDANATGNDAMTLGTIDSCRSVNVGDADFDVDVYITDASGLMGWSVYLTYDPALLSVASFSTSFMEPQFPASYDYGNGLLYLASAQTQNGGASGSGVLARITFHAVSNGSSALHIRTDAPYVPYLNNDPFSGSVSDAQIAIGQGCGVLTATPTPSPTPVITPSFPPTPTPTPSTTPTQHPSPTPPPSGSVQLKGDADCNGHVDVHDVLAALNLVAGAQPGASCPALADVDCDGNPDAEDALRILDFVGGTPPLPQPSGCAGVGTLTSG
jgi:Cohesin domain